jgi:hypothetical protein
MEIEGYPNYLIYPDGRVFSKKRNIFLKLGYCNGYHSIMLFNNKNKQKYTVHRLVAIHYIPNLNNLPFVNHKNGIRDDNRVENLEWCTCSYNNQSINCINKNLGCINYKKSRNRWRFIISINKKNYEWSFPTKEEAECQRILMKSMLEG